MDGTRTAIALGVAEGNAVCPSLLPEGPMGANDMHPPRGTLARLADLVGDSEAVRQWDMLLGAFRTTVAERVERRDR